MRREARERALVLFSILLMSWSTRADADEPPKKEQEEKEPAPLEVTVRGRKTNEPTAPKQSMEGKEIRIVPGAFGDAFRALDALPGVTPIVSGLPYYFVR